MSLRKSVNQKCVECIYDKSQEGSKYQQITNCTSKACPLFNVRPSFKSVTNGKKAA